MTSPPQHDWYCTYLGWSGGCPVCHSPASCRNCGHSALDHLYTDITERARTFWCPRCRGCGPDEEVDKPTDIKPHIHSDDNDLGR